MDEDGAEKEGGEKKEKKDKSKKKKGAEEGADNVFGITDAPAEDDDEESDSKAAG